MAQRFVSRISANKIQSEKAQGLCLGSSRPAFGGTYPCTAMMGARRSLRDSTWNPRSEELFVNMIATFLSRLQSFGGLANSRGESPMTLRHSLAAALPFRDCKIDLRCEKNVILRCVSKH